VSPGPRTLPGVGDVRVATWNLLHGRSLANGQVEEGALRAGVGMLDADVIALQEIDRHQQRSENLDQTSVVSDAAGATWSRFVPTVWGEPGARWQPVSSGDDDDGERAAYGIGLVSRLPVLESDVLRFEPTLPEEVAELTFPLHYRGHQIRVHLDHTCLNVSAAPSDLPAVQIGFDGKRETLRAGETLTFTMP